MSLTTLQVSYVVRYWNSMGIKAVYQCSRCGKTLNPNSSVDDHEDSGLDAEDTSIHCAICAELPIEFDEFDRFDYHRRVTNYRSEWSVTRENGERVVKLID